MNHDIVTNFDHVISLTSLDIGPLKLTSSHDGFTCKFNQCGIIIFLYNIQFFFMECTIYNYTYITNLTPIS